MIVSYHVSVRQTKHAIAIQAIIDQAPGPLSADEVRALLIDTGIGIATVYRVLKNGAEGGRFRAVQLPDGPTRYESADLPHHHHFECLACHRVFDVEGCPGRIERMAPEGFDVQSHDLTLYGKCVDCKKQGAA